MVSQEPCRCLTNRLPPADREHLAAETCEYFYVVLLDNKNRKLRDVMVSKGSLTVKRISTEPGEESLGHNAFWKKPSFRPDLRMSAGEDRADRNPAFIRTAS